MCTPLLVVLLTTKEGGRFAGKIIFGFAIEPQPPGCGADGHSSSGEEFLLVPPA